MPCFYDPDNYGLFEKRGLSRDNFKDRFNENIEIIPIIMEIAKHNKDEYLLNRVRNFSSKLPKRDRDLYDIVHDLEKTICFCCKYIFKKVLSFENKLKIWHDEHKRNDDFRIKQLWDERRLCRIKNNIKMHIKNCDYDFIIIGIK